MSQSNYITLALFISLGLIFLIDYLKKRKEDSLEKSVEKFVEKESETNERSGVLNWILKRKKNITFFVILVSTVKLFLNYFVYPIYLISTYPNNYHDLDIDIETWYKSICEKYDIVILHNPERISAGWKHNVDKFYDNSYNRAFPADFSVHLENIFSYDLFLFLPCSIFFLILVWIFNDKIKAQ